MIVIRGDVLNVRITAIFGSISSGASFSRRGRVCNADGTSASSFECNQTMSFLRAAFRTAARPRRLLPVPQRVTILRPLPFALHRATFATSSGLEKSEIQNRILDVLKSFEKVDPSKVSTIPSVAFHR